jgi:hypothetical protein
VKDLLHIKAKTTSVSKLQTPTELYEDTITNGCPGVQWQTHPGAEWTRIPSVFLKDALDIDFEGVLARGCLSLPDQKKVGSSFFSSCRFPFLRLPSCLPALLTS